MAIIRSVIRGVGAYLPKRVMTNNDLALLVDTTDEWIKERTGIEQRHIADDGELTSTWELQRHVRLWFVRASTPPTLISSSALPPHRTALSLRPL